MGEFWNDLYTLYAAKQAFSDKYWYIGDILIMGVVLILGYSVIKIKRK